MFVLINYVLLSPAQKQCKLCPVIVTPAYTPVWRRLLPFLSTPTTSRRHRTRLTRQHEQATMLKYRMSGTTTSAALWCCT